MKLNARPKTVIYLALLILGSSLAPLTAAQQSSGDWDFVSIIAPPQTVTVETPLGSYTAAFENEARVYPNGRARGVLELSGPNGTLHRFRVFAGQVQLDDGTVTRAVLHLREVGPGDHPRLEITVVIQQPAARLRSEFPSRVLNPSARSSKSLRPRPRTLRPLPLKPEPQESEDLGYVNPASEEIWNARGRMLVIRK